MCYRNDHTLSCGKLYHSILYTLNTLSISPYTLSSCIERYGTIYHGLNYGHAHNTCGIMAYFQRGGSQL